MKPVQLRPRARQDRRDEIRYYREAAGPRVAAKLVRALQGALLTIGANPAIGSPVLGQELGLDGMRTWLIEGFPLACWYFDRETYVDVVRLVGQRQDALRIEADQLEAR